MTTTNKKQRHAALAHLRHLCGMTAEKFSRITGIGYAQLVAVEQGRRELSNIDAEIISSATGVDPSFNDDKSNLKLKDGLGQNYDRHSYDNFREKHLPALRAAMAEQRKRGESDQLETAILNNAKELIKAARVRGQELAVCSYLQHVLAETADRFDLEQAMTTWCQVEVVDDPRKKLGVAIEAKRHKLPGIGRGLWSEGWGRIG